MIKKGNETVSVLSAGEDNLGTVVDLIYKEQSFDWKALSYSIR